jgi:hypothetical protein
MPEILLRIVLVAIGVGMVAGGISLGFVVALLLPKTRATSFLWGMAGGYTFTLAMVAAICAIYYIAVPINPWHGYIIYALILGLFDWLTILSYQFFSSIFGK